MMGNYEQLKTAVASIVRDNGAEEITGNVLQSVLISIINSVGSGAVFAGIATPSTSPSNPDPNMFYIAVEAGTYPNFNLTVTTGMCIFSNESGTWVGHELGVSSQFESGEYITEVSIIDTLEGAETDNLPTVGAVNGAVTAFNTAIATERQDRKEADGNQTVAINLEKTLRQQGDEANAASVGYYVCDTAAATAAKVVNASGYVLRIGGNIRIEMTHANTADNATLNINNTGAKALFYNGEQASASNSWEDGEVLTVYYDGTQYQCASSGTIQFDGEPTITPLTTGTIISGVDISNGKWTSVSQRKMVYAEYSYSEGDVFEVTGSQYGSGFAFVTSSSHNVGDDVPFAIAGETGWTNVPANTSMRYAVPNNCTYIVFNYGWQSSVVMPTVYRIVNTPTYTPDEVVQFMEETDKKVDTLTYFSEYIKPVLSFDRDGFVLDTGAYGFAADYNVYRIDNVAQVNFTNLSVFLAGDVPNAVIFDDGGSVLGSVARTTTAQRYDVFSVNMADYPTASYILLNTYKYSTHTPIDVSGYSHVVIRYPEYVESLKDEIKAEVSGTKEIKILFVGNSLTQDAVSYLPLLLREISPEVTFKLYDWYNAGITLNDQYNNYFLTDANASIFSVYESENQTAWTNYENSKNISWVLENCDFDIVVLQEYSYYTFSEANEKTYYDNMVGFFQDRYSKSLKFCSFMDAPNRSKVETMFANCEQLVSWHLKDCVSQSIIGAGAAVYYALQTELASLGDAGGLSPDGTHTQEGLPCLLQSYVIAIWMFEQLGIAKSICNSQTRITQAVWNALNPVGPNLGSGIITGTDAQHAIAQECAVKAAKLAKKLELNVLLNFGQ